MSIRLRIAALSAALAVIVLLAISGGVYFTLQRSLSQEVDKRLAGVVQGLASQSQIVQSPGGDIALGVPPVDPFSSRGLYMQVMDAKGQLHDQTSGPDDDSHLTPPDQVISQNQQGVSVFYTTEFRGVPSRVLSAPLIDPRSGTLLGTVQAAETLSPLYQTLGKLRGLLLGGLGLGLVVTAVGAFMLSGRSLRPLTRITTTARQIGRSGDLSQRIDLPKTGDEVQDLAETFNEMLERLADAFAAERRFVSDASHELRTPLTALRGNAEILLRQVAAGRLDEADAVEILTDIRDESERMGRLVQNLLTLARADVGWRPDLEPLELDVLASDIARLATPLAGDHRLTVDIEDEVDVIGNADQLKQLLLIMLDNAFSYTPEHGEVKLTVRRRSHRAELVVSDDGPGIPAEQLERVFDRFYRGEAARNQRTAGAGLGLAIARWIVECHYGDVTAHSEPNAGTSLIVTLPLLETSAPDQEETHELREPVVVATLGRG
jgi:heavy metal sensor kinase